MKHIICSSFGKDSNATALLALQHGEPLDEIIYTEVMFSKEISGELPEHTRFIYETAIPYFEKRGIPTRVLHAEKTYLDCFYHVVSRGNAQGKLAAFPLAGRCAIQRDCKVPPLEAYGPQGRSQLDDIFEDLAMEKPASFAARQYGLYHMAPDKTAQSIDVSLGMRMSAFNIPSIMKICEDDTIHLEELASDKKVALFVVTPDTTTAYNFLAAVMFQQCFQILVHTADNREDHCLPRHVRFLLDEFPNIGMIPDFQILISTIRSRNIGCTLIYQSIAQLKSQYGDDWGTILENCDSELVLGGGNNPESLEFFGKQLGKRTIEVLNTTENLGAQGSFSKNYQVASRDLMTPEEIRTMPRNRCLLMISGVVPFYSYKFDLKKHPNYALVEKEGHRPFDYERRAENNFAAFMKNVQEINNIELDDDESYT